jgi:hypothetical protein
VLTDIERTLAAADPARAIDLEAVPDSAAQEVLHEVIARAARGGPSRRRARRRRLTAFVAVAALVIPAAALAAYGGIHSGFFGTGGEDVAGEEFLNADAPGITTVVRELTKEFPLPAGTSYAPLLRRYPSREHVLVQRTGLGQEVSFYAACAWYRSWLGGDAAVRASAQPTIEAIPGWRYWRFAVDPSTGENPGRDLLERIARETRAGRSGALTSFVRANC